MDRPLVPGCGLLLDRISWFSLRTGDFEADPIQVPRLPDAEMIAFKRRYLKTHMGSLMADLAARIFNPSSAPRPWTVPGLQ